MTTNTIEETTEMFHSRHDLSLLSGIGMMVLLWVGVGLIHLGNEVFRRYEPEAFPLGPAGTLVLSIIVAGFLFAWASVVVVFLAACRATPVRIGNDGIQMPSVPFRKWLRGGRTHLVPWERARLVKITRLRGGRWGAILSDGSWRRYGLNGEWFGQDAVAALEEIRARLATRHPSSRDREKQS